MNSETQYISKFGKPSGGHRTEKVQFSFQSQRKAMPKNAQTTTGLLTLFYLFYYYYYFLLYNIVLVLPYINMHLPRVYTCSPS